VSVPAGLPHRGGGDTHRLGSGVYPSAGLYTVGYRQIFCLCREWNPVRGGTRSPSLTSYLFDVFDTVHINSLGSIRFRSVVA
jgi:hypothetical protein